MENSIMVVGGCFYMSMNLLENGLIYVSYYINF